MIGGRSELDTARDRAQAARMRLMGTLKDVQQRLSPGVLAQEVLRELRERGADAAAEAVQAARARPVRTAAIALVITAFFARKPLARLVTALFLRRDETREPDEG
jgi:hypothetical protein